MRRSKDLLLLVREVFLNFKRIVHSLKADFLS